MIDSAWNVAMLINYTLYINLSFDPQTTMQVQVNGAFVWSNGCKRYDTESSQ